MGVSFQACNPKDGSHPYRPHSGDSELPGQAQRSSVIHATLRCGAPTIMMWRFGAVPTTTGQMVAGLKRDPHAPVKDAIHPRPVESSSGGPPHLNSRRIQPQLNIL